MARPVDKLGRDQAARIASEAYGVNDMRNMQHALDRISVLREAGEPFDVILRRLNPRPLRVAATRDTEMQRYEQMWRGITRLERELETGVS